jgi:DNA-directed RNA polymerase specialized sigma24 family protein
MTFDEFLDTQLGPLTRYARVLSGDRQSAHDDLFANTLVAASKRWDNIGQLDLPAAHVRRMLTNRQIYYDISTQERVSRTGCNRSNSSSGVRSVSAQASRLPSVSTLAFEAQGEQRQFSGSTRASRSSAIWSISNRPGPS